MIILPHKALEVLIDSADANVNNQGHHVESLAFLLAVQHGENYTVSDVFLPTQSSSGAFVEDHGVDSQDTSTFIQTLCSENPEKRVIG